MSKKILIVDDMRANRLILKAMLSRDYCVIEAVNGAEALEALRKYETDISAVLLDIGMPVMDGFEALHRIREDLQLSKLPVIMITGSDDEQSRINSLTQGASDYVTKPYSPEIILHCLRNHIAFNEASETVNALKRDSLTALYSRESFFDRVREMVNEHENGYYVMTCFDIDKFKVINDQYGTEKGDEVLRHVASVFREGFGKAGGVCSRISADHFAVLYPRTFIDSEEIKQIRDNSAVVEGIIFPITFSIGRYIVEDKTMEPSAMYDRAMLASESVKKRFDKKIAFYDEAMREHIINEQAIVSDMKPALASKQFETWFQPQYNHSTGALIGAEALVRWRHPLKGLISPALFIPTFEQNGFIYELDKYVWEDVCRYLRKWLDEGRNPLPVSVNVSRYDILQPELTEVIGGLLKKYSLPVEMLRLEVTETAFADSPESVISVVKTLIDMGFTVEIDDFGSGYSSLNTLKDVPAQILKLDMKFIERGDSSQRGGNIVESVIRMAKWIGMSVIAEGVEDKKQADFLCTVGCNYIQGYLYAKPMPAPEYEEHCREVGKEEHLLSLQTVENLDNNAFWDPQSIDTLIFNSYVGAACIFEFHKDKIELIRATEMFAQALSDTASADDFLKIDWAKHIDEDNLRAVKDVLDESISKKIPVAHEYIFTDLPGCHKKTYLRSTMRVIATTGERKLIYCTNENITSQREAESKIKDTDAQIHFLNEMSHELLAQPDTDISIKSVLNKLLEYFQGNRAYIFEFAQDMSTLSNTYEICAPNVTSEIGNLQNIPCEYVNVWLSNFEQFGYIAISDISALGDDRSIERETLSLQGISSLFAAPIYRDGKIIGMMGIDDPCRRLDQVASFVALGDYIAVMLTRRDLTAKIKNDSRVLMTLMNDTPGGFARMRIHPDGTGYTEYVNDGFCKMLGMTREEILDYYKDDVMAGVHPDDLNKVNAGVAQSMSPDGIMTAKYRLRHKNGTYIWVQLFARFTTENEDTLINAYYIDLADKEKRELAVRETMPFILSTIMKSSPNLDFAKDKDYRYICCSSNFARFAGQQDESGVIGKTDFELFDRKTAEQFRKADVKVFESGESLVEFTEPVPSNDDIQHYSVTSKYLLRDSAGEIIGIYGTGKDVTDIRSALDRLQLLTDSIPGGIARFAVTKNDIKMTYFNDGICKMLGCSREEYLKYRNDDVTLRIFPDDLPGLMEQVKNLYDNGVPVNCNYRNHKINSDGYIWINIRGEVAERQDDICFVNAVLYDMTLQYEAVKSENEISDRLRAIMQNISGGVLAAEADGDKQTVIFANEQYYNILGYTKEQFETEVGDIMSIVHTDDREAVRKTVSGLLSNHKSAFFEYRCIKRGGDVINLHCNATCTKLSGIDNDVLLSVISDITEITKARRKEKQLTQQMQSVMESVESGICAAVVDGENVSFVFTNDRFYDIHGYTRAQFTEEIQNVFDTFNPEDRQRVSEAIKNSNLTGKPVTVEYRIIRRDKQERWVRMSVSSHLFEGISSNVQVSVIVDITDKKLAELEMQVMNENLRIMMNDTPGGFARIRMTENGRAEPEFVNEPFCRMCNMTSDEIFETVRDSLFNLIHPDDRTLLRKAGTELLQNGETYTVQCRLIQKNKGFIPVNLRGRTSRDRAGTVYINTYFTDLSETEKQVYDWRQAVVDILSAIMEKSNDYAFAKDKDFRYICCSPALLTLAGLENVSEVIGKTDFDLFPKDMARQFRQNDIELLEQGVPLIDFTETVHGTNGELHYCKASKYILKDNAGEYIGLYGISRDITSEHTAFEQLKMITDSVPGGIARYKVSPEGNSILYYNDGFCKMLGCTREEYERLAETSVMSRVFEDDMPGLMMQVESLKNNGTPIDYTYRSKKFDGSGYVWINLHGVLSEHCGDDIYINAVLYDITKQQNVLEKLRISEEENILAVRHGGNLVCRYNVENKTLTASPEIAGEYGVNEVLYNVPEEPIASGIISPETADAYRGFFEAIQKGNKSGTVLFRQKYLDEWQWTEAKSSTVFSGDGKPVKAVISMNNVTEKMEKEAIYIKWQQSLEERQAESFTLFRINLNQHGKYDSKQGDLFDFDVDSAGDSSNEITKNYAQKRVYEKDRDKYINFINVDTMLANYYRGKRSDAIEYRQTDEDGKIRWLRLSVDLVEYPNSTDVEAYLLYEDIDEGKRAELQVIELAKTDPLTGLLNRTAFAENVNKILAESKPGDKSAMLMLDIDGFKRVNDVFGHNTGDSTLIAVGNGLKNIFRSDDLVSRIGGDEYMIFMNGIREETDAEYKARQICAMTRRQYSMEVEISGSVGIVFAPHDGVDYDTLYKKVDAALYHVKGSGKDNIAVYTEDMKDEHLEPENDSVKTVEISKPRKKRRMLIVDDNSIDYTMLQNIFKDEFIIEKARDGASALIRLRHYGSAISVVLLDLVMPVMDGFTVLEKMQENPEISSIPVVVVSGDESRETCLKVIRCGATDFVTKPVDAEILKIRVSSAISKSENDRLRAKNNQLEADNTEKMLYDTVLKHSGVLFIELNWLTGEFTYFPMISKFLLGTYDNRRLWRILLSDMVADSLTVQKMQELIHSMAQDRDTTDGSIIVNLKTPQRAVHRFRMTVHKLCGDRQLTKKFIISMYDLDIDR